MPVTERVEAVSVDRSAVFLESEETRSGITRLIESEQNPNGLITSAYLRLRRDTSHLDIAKSEIEEPVNRLGVFVETRCHANGVGHG
jgi:hypothetical protein